jgi:hypothetical protein
LRKRIKTLRGSGEIESCSAKGKIFGKGGKRKRRRKSKKVIEKSEGKIL